MIKRYGFNLGYLLLADEEVVTTKTRMCRTDLKHSLILLQAHYYTVEAGFRLRRIPVLQIRIFTMWGCVSVSVTEKMERCGYHEMEREGRSGVSDTLRLKREDGLLAFYRAEKHSAAVFSDRFNLTVLRLTSVSLYRKDGMWGIVRT